MFFQNKTKVITLVLISIFGIFLITNIALAADCPLQGPQWLQDVYGIEKGLLIPCDCLVGKQANVECGLNEVMQTIINFSKLILSLVGSLALLMFIYGGFIFILAGGNAERIESGKKIIIGAIFGIIIILSAWVIVNFVIFALTGGEIGSVAEIFKGTPWAQPWAKP